MKRMSKSKGFTLVEIMIVVAIIGIIIAIAVPGFIRARATSRMRACQENLTKIEGAIEQLALERNLAPTSSVTQAQLTDGNTPGDGNGILKRWPIEPSGGSYVLAATIGTNPPITCDTGLPGHNLAAVGTATLADESAGGGS